MSARRFELEKKKQAVRRLSQSGRRNLPSPRGPENISGFLNAGLTAEEQRKKRIQRKNVNFKGNPEAQNQGLRPSIVGRPLTKMDEQRQKRPNPYIWEKADLRQKLTKQDGSREAQKSEHDPEKVSSVQTSTSFNPFATALATPGSNINPIDTEKSTQVVALSSKPENPFSYHTNPGEIQSNPFALALKSKTEYQPAQVEQEKHPVKPVFGLSRMNDPKSSFGFGNPLVASMHKNTEVEKLETKSLLQAQIELRSEKSVSGLPMPVNPKLDSDFGFINPFATALQKKQDAPFIQSSSFSRPGRQEHGFSGSFANNQEFGSASIANSTAIQLMNVPDELNEREFLRSHFLKFGDIKRVYRHVASKSAIITFFNHDSAVNAKGNGTVLRDDLAPIQIFWHVSKSSQHGELEDNSDDNVMQKMPPAYKDIKPLTFGEKSVTESKKNSNTLARVVSDFAKAFANVPAKDVNEKAEILEKIDQKIREGRKKENDLMRAAVVTGTCPDMCPEKERYLREYQRRLAPFEMQIGTENTDHFAGQFPTIDHSKAIKEYSRSSADQEEPLPHELRPASVLKMTMDYLVLNVMDASHGNWAEWYDFVWNRTRGIRKDITQQHLCNEISVELIEKCARFHIICAHHLCEEDMNAFDPKINNENLTKCLQSLKHMYDDISTQKGSSCRNESEFRCYQVLLNLNNTDILREVMEFRQEIRDSQEVKFALEVFRALNSSNYVRFFKLLGAASYLMACIMQRYFNQIRSKGLLLMNRAYGAVNKPVPFLLKDITRLFAIDEEDEVSEFCQHYGMTVDEGLVYFSKSSYEEPETNFLPVRSGTIERKRTCTIGEVVNGEPLPSNIGYKPTISFDYEARYNGQYHELALSGIQQQDTDETPSDANLAAIASNVPLKVTRQDLSHVTIDVICSTVAVEVHKLATDTVEQSNQALKAGEDIMKDILHETISADVRAIAQVEAESLNMIRETWEDLLTQVTRPLLKQLITEVCQEENKRKSEEERMLVFKLATEAARCIIDNETSVLAKQIAIETLREEKNTQFLSAVSEASALLGREMLEKQMSKEVLSICNEAIADEAKQRKENLELLRRQVTIARMSRLYKRWVLAFRARKHIRETLRGFPACPPSQSSHKIINRLTGHKKHDANLPEYILLKNGTELSVSSVSSLKRKRDRHRDAIKKYHQRIATEKQESKRPLDGKPLFDAMMNCAPRRGCKERIFSNILVHFPEMKDLQSTEYFHTQLLRNKLSMGLDDCFAQSEDTGIQCVETLTSITEYAEGVSANLCIQAVSASFIHDAEEIKKSRCLHGITGIIFIIDAQAMWTSQRDGLFSIFSLRPKIPALSLLIIALNMPESQTEAILIDSLNLHELKNRNLCSSFEIFRVAADDNSSQINDKLTNSLITMMRNTPKFPELRTKTLIKFIEEGLELYFYEPLYENGSKRGQFGISTQNPQVAIELYNSVLDHLMAVCTSSRLQQLSWPSRNMTMTSFGDYPELNWNSKETFSKLRNVIQSLKLPALSKDAKSNGCWDDQVEICLNYIKQVSAFHQDLVHPSKLLSRIEQLLIRYKEKWKYRSYSTFLEFPWDSVVEECTIFILTPYQTPMSHSDVRGDSLMSYFEDDYRQFKPALAWIEAARSLRNETYLRQLQSDEDSLVSAHNLSSRDEYIENSIKATNEDIFKLDASRCSSASPSVTDDFSSIYQKLKEKQELLDQSLSCEKLAYSRLNSSSNLHISEDILENSPAHQLKSLKRKRARDFSVLESSSEFENTRPIENTFDHGAIDDLENKRPKQLLESRLDDLLKEVQFMRSTTKLDSYRYNELVNS
eukprot:gene11995-13233_t